MSTYSRDTTAISEITGQPVNTWSEEWQRECEARAILKMSKVQRDEFFNGKKDENGKTLERGIVARCRLGCGGLLRGWRSLRVLKPTKRDSGVGAPGSHWRPRHDGP
ncbi:DUF7696 family protein, partial [Microvirga arsenatis]|uniref:DUF7696 family protein n=1 Tax=Microvirga arsenatis TaxID=2692265 RepID=UPI003CCDB447